MEKRRLEIIAFRCQRTLILQQRPGVEREAVTQIDAYEEWTTSIEAIRSPAMRRFLEVLGESEADHGRPDEQVKSRRTSFYVKLRRLMVWT